MSFTEYNQLLSAKGNEMSLCSTIRLINDDSYQAVIDEDLSCFDVIDGGNELELDKFWHVVSYLLTGNTENAFLKIGVQLPEVSETAEVISPEETKEINKQIQKIDLSNLQNNYSIKYLEQKDIYPGCWQEVEFSEIEPYIKQSVQFINYAANNNYGLFITIM